jgi:hypothetical protein
MATHIHHDVPCIQPHQHAQPSLGPSVRALPRFTRASSCLFKFVCPPTPRGPFKLVSGMAFAIAVNTSATLCPVFALVSKNNKLSSSAYAFAVLLGTLLELTPSSVGSSSPSAAGAASTSSAFSSSAAVAKSNLFPTSAITMPGRLGGAVRRPNAGLL